MNKAVQKQRLLLTHRVLWLVIMWFMIHPLAAQETKVVRDLGLWTGVEIEKSFMKDWMFSLKQEIRLKKDVSEINNYFTQAGIRYRINRNFSLEAKYRFTRNRKSDESYETRSRYSFDLRYKGKLDFISVYYRLRYQKEVEGMNLLDSREPYEKYLRNRLSIRYNDFKKIEPYLSGEIFQLFELYQFPRYDYMRLLAGIRYKPGKIGEFNVAYGFNHELNTTLPATGYIIRVNYTYSF